MEKLIQLRVSEEVKTACDKIFEQDGLTTQQAVKTFLYQVAKSGKSPFDAVFSSYLPRPRELRVAEPEAIYEVKGANDGE